MVHHQGHFGPGGDVGPWSRNLLAPGHNNKLRRPKKSTHSHMLTPASTRVGAGPQAMGEKACTSGLLRGPDCQGPLDGESGDHVSGSSGCAGQRQNPLKAGRPSSSPASSGRRVVLAVLRAAAERRIRVSTRCSQARRIKKALNPEAAVDHGQDLRFLHEYSLGLGQDQDSVAWSFVLIAPTPCPAVTSAHGAHGTSRRSAAWNRFLVPKL